MSLTLALNSAVTGLSTAQAGLDVISNNIANVNTAGYTRKVFEQNTLVLAGQGAGVELGPVTSTINENLLGSVRQTNGNVGVLQTLQSYLQQIQDTFGSTATNSSIAADLNNLAQQFTTLSTNPSNATAQLQAVQAG